MAEFMIGEPIEQSEVKRYMKDRVTYIDDSYWYVKKFIEFQYGKIKSDSVSKSVVKLLEKHNLHEEITRLSEASEIGASKPLPRGYVASKDKDKDKDKVKDKDKDKIKSGETKKESLGDLLDEIVSSISVELRDSVIMQALSTTSLSDDEKSMYLLRLKSDDYCRVVGGNFVHMKLSQVQPHALYMSKQGWLKSAKPKSEETPQYKTVGGYWNFDEVKE
jgi:hypothetical protein